MALQIYGTSGAVPVDVEQTGKALRVSGRPNDAAGYFRLAAFAAAALTTTAADGVLFSFRSAPTGLTIIRRIQIKYLPIVNYTASQEIAAEVMVARAFTISDSAGTAIVPANVSKLRTSNTASAAADIRITSGNAVALTAGTRTLDANPILYGVDANKLGAGAPGGFTETLDYTDRQAHPLILDANQGFIVRNKILLGAGGSIRFSVTVDWEEAATY